MSDRRDESGLTLIELLISIVLLGIVIVPLTGAMIDGLRSTTESQKRLNESRSPLFTSAFFAEDAQSADADGITTGGAPACGATGTNVVSFAWKEDAIPYSASYVLDTTGINTVLKRYYCANGGASSIVVAPILGTDAGCGQPACASVDDVVHPRTVTLTATTPNAENFFTLSATRRAT